MSRKIRNLAGEPVGAREANREIWRNMWGVKEKKVKKPLVSISEDELVSRYFAHRLIIDPSSSVVSTELIQDFIEWASERNFRFNRSRVVPMILESDLVTTGHARSVRRVQRAEVTGSLLARLDTNNPPTSQKITVWHGLRWADDDAEELI